MGFKNKISVVTLFIMSIVCTAALFIAVKVTVVAVERQEQEVYRSPLGGEKSVPVLSKKVNVSKLTEQNFILNGIVPNNIPSFLTDKKDFMLPLDSILDYLGIKYKLYSPDDIVEAEVNGKKLVIKIGKDTFSYGENDNKLQVAPVIAKDHILVPVEVFLNIQGFGTSASSWKNTVFLNYYKDLQQLQSQKIKVLKLTNGHGGIWDITGTRELWDRNEVPAGLESFEASPKGSKYVLKSNKDTFMINPDISPNPYKIQVGEIIGWDKDGRYVYWEDNQSDKILLYDSEKSSKSEITGYIKSMENQENFSSFSHGIYGLEKFVELGSYKRISLENLILGKTYSIIKKNNDVVAEGNIKFSPDGKKMLYKKSNGSYYIANVDGTASVELGDGLKADWIANNRISIDRGYEEVLFDSKGKWRYSSKTECKRLGQAEDGSLFYTDGSTLYAEKDSKEREIMKLPWETSYVYSSSIDGPYIIGSEKEDGVYYVNSANLNFIGKYSLLQRSYEGYKYGYDLKESLTISPERDYFMMLQRESDITTLSFVNTVDNSVKEAVLDCKMRDDLKVKWLQNGNVIVYNASQLWLIDFKDTIQIYNYKEQPGGSIEGILLKEAVKT